MRAAPNTELIWASPAELLNIFQADEIGCQVITVTDEDIIKLSLVLVKPPLTSCRTATFRTGKAAGYKL